MPYLVDRSGSAPELIVDLLEKLPQAFNSPEQISALAHTAGERTNYVAFDKAFFEPVAVALVANGGTDTSELTLIAVRPDHQGKTVGRRVLARILEDLVTDGIKTLVVNAADANYFTGATAFLASVGFTQSAFSPHLELEVATAAI